MRVKYCCDLKAYQSYYLNQIWSGGSLFSDAPFQNEYGLGGIFSDLAKLIMPLIKSGAKAIGKQALKGGLSLASDIFAGKDTKKAAVERAKMAVSSLFDRLQVVNAKLQHEYKRNDASEQTTYSVRMASLIHPSSSGSVTSQLDLFSVPPTKTSLEDVFFTEYRPISVLPQVAQWSFVLPLKAQTTLI